jgi:hypothetical protein
MKSFLNSGVLYTTDCRLPYGQWMRFVFALLYSSKILYCSDQLFSFLTANQYIISTINKVLRIAQLYCKSVKVSVLGTWHSSILDDIRTKCYSFVFQLSRFLFSVGIGMVGIGMVGIAVAPLARASVFKSGIELLGEIKWDLATTGSSQAGWKDCKGLRCTRKTGQSWPTRLY